MITLDKMRVNIWNMGTAAIGLTVTAFGWGMTYSSMLFATTQLQKNIDGITSEIRDIKGHIPTIAQLQYQSSRLIEISSENKANIAATNERVDRVVESFGGKLDNISTNLNKLATQVEVLATRLNETKQQGKQP